MQKKAKNTKKEKKPSQKHGCFTVICALIIFGVIISPFTSDKEKNNVTTTEVPVISQSSTKNQSAKSKSDVSSISSMAQTDNTNSAEPSSKPEHEAVATLAKNETIVDNVEEESQKPLKTTEEVCAEIMSNVYYYVADNDVINEVSLANNVLRINIDISKTPLEWSEMETAAVIRTSSITKEILRHNDYDDLWNEIIVDFGEIGYISNIKDKIITDKYGRFFNSDDFQLTSSSIASSIETGATNMTLPSEPDNLSSDTSMALTVESNKDITNDSKGNVDSLSAEYESVVETSYIGNTNSKKFHEESCSKLPAPKNQTALSSRDEAIRRGYEPCKICNP